MALNAPSRAHQGSVARKGGREAAKVGRARGFMTLLSATPETVAAFVAAEAEGGAKASTIGRRLAAIRCAHKPAGLAVPTDDERVRATARGIRRTIGTARTRKAPATNNRLLAMVALHGRTLSALRDRALLLLGFAGAFRRSELVA